MPLALGVPIEMVDQSQRTFSFARRSLRLYRRNFTQFLQARSSCESGGTLGCKDEKPHRRGPPAPARKHLIAEPKLPNTAPLTRHASERANPILSVTTDSRSSDHPPTYSLFLPGLIPRSRPLDNVIVRCRYDIVRDSHCRARHKRPY